MGCQTAIAEPIVDKEANYILAVKGNQEHLPDDIKEAFEQTPEREKISSTVETGYGRIEKRTCQVITDTDRVCSREEWKQLKSLIKITTARTDKLSGHTQKEYRYYISSAIGDASTMLNNISCTAE